MRTGQKKAVLRRAGISEEGRLGPLLKFPQLRKKLWQVISFEPVESSGRHDAQLCRLNNIRLAVLGISWNAIGWRSAEHQEVLHKSSNAAEACIVVAVSSAT